jgi:two-component system, NarL family, response regulator DevR
MRAALEGVDDMEVVAEACVAAQLVPLIERTSPDVVLFDLDMPGFELASIKSIAAKHAELTLVVTSNSNDGATVVRALQNGASGYIFKGIHPADLAAAIRQSVSRTFFSLGGLGVPVEVVEPEGRLSEREVEVLQRLAGGLSNRAIATDLWLSDQTIKFHVRNIYRKLGVSNRTEAAGYAFRNGLSDVPNL